MRWATRGVVTHDRRIDSRIHIVLILYKFCAHVRHLKSGLRMVGG
jgi:hypothetical protein